MQSKLATKWNTTAPSTSKLNGRSYEGELHQFSKARRKGAILAFMASFNKDQAYRLVLEIGERNFVHATLESIGGDPGALGPVDQGLSDLANLEDGGGPHVVPVLAGEGIDNLLLDALLASLGEALKKNKEIISEAPTLFECP